MDDIEPVEMEVLEEPLSEFEDLEEEYISSHRSCED